MKILFSWIGHKDLFGFANAKGLQEEVKALLDGKPIESEVKGPIKTALEDMQFDKAVLLWNYKKSNLMELYSEYCGENICVLHAPIGKDPTDYSAIYCAARDAINSNYSPDNELCYLLTPGTSSMTAVWVLLGKTKFAGTFWQTYRNKLQETKIPFDIAVDFLPDALSKTEDALRNLPDVSMVKGFEDINGSSLAIKKAVQIAEKAAKYNVSVLLTGESGVGKERFARAIHNASLRKEKKFFAVNCGAFSDNLLQSELFGHKKGAYTGADEDYEGVFKKADGGTLFLDEIGECSLATQKMLLRVLQPTKGKGLSYREFTPLMSKINEHSDVRIIAATNRNLFEMIANGQFREDLYYRLAEIALQLPSLRDRTEDIPTLAEALLGEINESFRRENPDYKDKKFSDDTKIFVKKYDWRGNVRELRSAILQGVVMSDKEKIEISDMGLSGAPSVPEKALKISKIPVGFNLDNTLEDIRKQYILTALDQSGGVKAQAARLLGYEKASNLDHWLKKFKI